MHDEALIIQWRNRGDAEAFRTIIQRYGRMVYATALRILGNPADAEDVAQDCFEKLARTSKSPRGYLGPWLHRMAVNRALDRVRSDTARKRRETAYQDALPSAAELSWDDIYPLVDDAIDQLPDKLRRAVVGHFLEGLTHEEIAQRESVSRAAITQRINRALGQMRTKLQRKGVAVSAVSVLAGTLGSRLAEAAVLPVSLTEKLGRIALSGPVVGKAGVVAGVVTLPKVAVGFVSILAVVAGVIAFSRLSSTPPPAPGADSNAEVLVAGEPTESEPQTTGRSPHQLVEAVSAALATPDSGTTATVSGRVYDMATGDPVPNAEISSHVGEQRYKAMSDPQGRYVFESVEAGEFSMLCRSANGYYLAHERYEGGPSPYRRTLNLTAGRHYEGIDFALEKGLAITGRVVDPNGSPVAGAIVTGHAEINNFWLTNTAMTASDGSFDVSGFPETVSLSLWAERDDAVSESYGPFALPQLADSAPEITLWPEAVIRGVVVDRAGAPVEGLRVLPQFAPHVSGREIEAVSDVNGAFELKGMPPGTSSLRVCRDVEIVNSPCPQFTLTAGEVVDDAILECSVGTGYIAGVVVDGRGNPLTAEVRSSSPDGSDSRTRANGAGMFVLEGLPAGTHRLTAYDWGRHIFGEAVEAKTGESTVRLVLHDPISVSGKVVDAKSGEPIANFEIKDCYAPGLIIHDQRYEPVHNPDGAFDLSVVQTGEVRIAARAKGYLLGYTDVQLALGQEPLSGVEIHLEPHGDLNGTVVDSEGAPVSGALIFSGKVQVSDADDFASARTGSDGAFILPASKLLGDTLLVYHPDYPETEVTVEPAHRAGRPMDIQIADSVQLECAFLVDGVPVTGASVSLTRDGEEKQAQRNHQVTAQNGLCQFRGLAPGVYSVTGSPPGQELPLFMSVATELELREGESVHVDLPFETGTGSVSGAIAGYADYMNVHLEIPRASGTQQYHFISEDGTNSRQRVDIPDLPAGPATLTISWGVRGQASYRVEREIQLQPGTAIDPGFDLETLAGEAQVFR
ncbi:MAG: RNA polymerase sigma factor [Candidatus Hydrogenedentes bacterium]|nr:RNA polymerase sigma factor [Candidatus Hydrogenedentota bacterium]